MVERLKLGDRVRMTAEIQLESGDKVPRGTMATICAIDLATGEVRMKFESSLTTLSLWPGSEAEIINKLALATDDPLVWCGLQPRMMIVDQITGSPNDTAIGSTR